ncbi:MAG: sigma-54-dependent Fis family transcriptional regulator [Nitrospirae bacterium]|nr:MAG: sigma-54-dependent Fis family transcriptional regulator [Nitrospirota bacterium]
MPEKVLVIDDDEIVREVLVEHLENEGYEVTACSTGYRGLEIFRNDKFDLIILDLIMPGINGLEVLKEIKRFSPHSVVILVTAFGSIENAVDAMRAGAFDYITKPFNLADVSFAVKRGLGVSKLEKENIALKRQLKNRYGFENIIGDSNAMQHIYSLIDKVAPTDSTVMILGESGTGKELIANVIHYNSERNLKPLVTVNCSAIPHELLETELFGHEKGAFTGAVSTKLGKFEIADGGTVFLDEIGDMTPDLQVKILRVLQERAFERVGGTKTIKVDVRIIAATNKNLEDEVSAGRFREDLYYRLNVIPMQLPPLRERTEDLPLLCNYFINKYCKKREKPLMKMSEETMSALANYSWPGNVRELENLIERLVVLKEDETVVMSDLPEKIAVGFKNNLNFKSAITHELNIGNIDFDKRVTDFEKYIISHAIKSAKGVKSRAARLLNIKRTTLVEKMKRFKIQG